MPRALPIGGLALGLFARSGIWGVIGLMVALVAAVGVFGVVTG